MKSIRLNINTRNQIIDNIMAAYSKENVRPEAPRNAVNDLHTAVLDWHLTSHKKELTKFNKIDKQYPRLINKTSNIRYKAPDGSVYYVYLHTGTTAFKDADGNTCDVDLHYIPLLNAGLTIDLSNPDTEIPESIQNVIDAIKNEKKSIKVQKEKVQKYDATYNAYKESVSQVIFGVNTTKQLIEACPKVKRFLPTGLAEPNTIQLPTVSIAALEDQLG